MLTSTFLALVNTFILATCLCVSSKKEASNSPCADNDDLSELRSAGDPHWLAGCFSCGSHHVVTGAGAGAGAGQLRCVLLLPEAVLLVAGAAVLTRRSAHPGLVIALLLLQSAALFHVQLANTHLNAGVAGDVAAPGHQFFVLLVLLGQRW